MNATDIHHAHPSLEAVGRALPWLIIAILVAMVSLTVGAALWLAADGAAHPAIIAGVLVAAIVGFGADGVRAARPRTAGDRCRGRGASVSRNHRKGQFRVVHSGQAHAHL